MRLEDVARLAQVSTATASRVINSPSSVRGETRQRVEAAIERLGWIPHGAAKALASFRTRTVGALIPTLGHQTIATMLESLQRGLRAEGFTLLLGNPDESDPDLTIAQAERMVQAGVEGMVVMGEDHPRQLFDLLERRKLPFLVVYTTGETFPERCVGFDNFAEMAELTRHLLDLGHTRFGLISRDYQRNDRLRLRVNGVRATLAEAGIALRPQHVKTVSGWNISRGREAMRAMLSEDMRPTAIICTNDYLAFGAVCEAQAAGLSVPRDISVTGFDDVELAANMQPPLTTVHVPATGMGAAVSRAIIHEIESGSVCREVVKGTLTVRGSTGPVPPS
ncbi:LacI family DNA-binding transcriptional regulator [Tropicimonas sp. IMCC34011]|uniref:LacI family DNA-binding transcriptional regulator n=1 Tax=Tropicimonas sp. IMCC34011 TaxID=2248759 RepID=UPI0018E54944|nr:LacI family DNA-binding transcriptional regulator [Tropicimonas sp. IMCC34011]